VFLASWCIIEEKKAFIELFASQIYISTTDRKIYYKCDREKEHISWDSKVV